MLRFESSQQPTANSSRSSSSSLSSSLSDASDPSDSESTNKPDSTLPVYEEYMSSPPTSQQPSSTLADAPEDGTKNLVQVLERLEKALNQQQTQTAETSGSPPPPPPPQSGPSPSKKVKSAGGSASSQSSAKTKKQLEEVFATVRDKLHEVSELLKQ